MRMSREVELPGVVQSRLVGGARGDAKTVENIVLFAARCRERRAARDAAWPRHCGLPFNSRRVAEALQCVFDRLVSGRRRPEVILVQKTSAIRTRVK